MAKEAFVFNPLAGTLFPGAKYWTGVWSETGGQPTHDLALQVQDDDSIIVAFRKQGSKGWTKAPVVKAVEDPEVLASRSHKGYVTFKGHKLHLWKNYAKEHDGDDDYARLDLKPSTRVACPL
jgi:hypothetical protein